MNDIIEIIKGADPQASPEARRERRRMYQLLYQRRRRERLRQEKRGGNRRTVESEFESAADLTSTTSAARSESSMVHVNGIQTPRSSGSSETSDLRHYVHMQLSGLREQLRQGKSATQFDRLEYRRLYQCLYQRERRKQMSAKRKALGSGSLCQVQSVQAEQTQRVDNTCLSDLLSPPSDSVHAKQFIEAIGDRGSLHVPLVSAVKPSQVGQQQLSTSVMSCVQDDQHSVLVCAQNSLADARQEHRRLYQCHYQRERRERQKAVRDKYQGQPGSVKSQNFKNQVYESSPLCAIPSVGATFQAELVGLIGKGQFNKQIVRAHAFSGHLASKSDSLHPSLETKARLEERRLYQCLYQRERRQRLAEERKALSGLQ